MTSREFASLIGVSQSAVSRALNGNGSIAPETRSYIVKMAEEYGFVLNSQAKSLRTSKTGTIGVLFPPNFTCMSKNLMFTNLYDCLQHELIKRDYDIMIIDDFSVPHETQSFERILKSKKVDGFVNFRQNLSAKEISLIERFEIPFVSMHSARQRYPQFHQFILDTEAAGLRAGEFLGRLNLDEYLYVTTDSNIIEHSRRLRGYERGLSARGMRLSENGILSAPFDLPAIRQMILDNAELFRGKTAGIFAYNDMVAMAVCNALAQLSIPVPERIQIIGMDDIPMASWFHPQLTTLRTPVEQMIGDGCSMLFRLVNGEKIAPQCRFYTSTLIERETTRSAAN